MSTFYPRRIRILRPKASGSFGAVGYGGLRAGAGEEIIAERVPAAIQLKGGGGHPQPDLPSDALRRSMWRVLIPQGALTPQQAVKVRDLLEDDMGVRYQVTEPYPTTFGFQILAERLEA